VDHCGDDDSGIHDIRRVSDGEQLTHSKRQMLVEWDRLTQPTQLDDRMLTRPTAPDITSTAPGRPPSH